MSRRYRFLRSPAVAVLLIPIWDRRSRPVKKKKREREFALSDYTIRILDVLVERLLNRILRDVADDLLLHFAVLKDQ